MVAQLDLLVPREMHQSKVIRGKRETNEINIDLQRGFYLTRVVRHKELRMSFAPWRPLSRSSTINLNLLCYALFFPIFAERSLLLLLSLPWIIIILVSLSSVQGPLLHRCVLGLFRRSSQSSNFYDHHRDQISNSGGNIFCKI